MVSSTFTLNSLPDYVFFDLGATYSFVLANLSTQLTNKLTPTSEHIIIEITDKRCVVVKDEYHGCWLGIYGTDFHKYPKPVTTREFYVMYNKKITIVEAPDTSLVMIWGEKCCEEIPVISMVKAWTDLNKGDILYASHKKLYTKMIVDDV